MSKLKRMIVGVAVLELLLLGGWILLDDLATASPRATAEGTRVIGEMFGWAMALVLVLTPVLHLLMRKKERRQAVAPMRRAIPLRQVVRP
jgi:hypothetical protein